MKKTNAMRLLDQQKISYEVLEFQPQDHMTGVDVANLNHLKLSSVFKTLVTSDLSGQYYVFVVPVAESLDAKLAAMEVGAKKIEMIPQKDLLPLTGYVHGGCSPFGMKKSFPTYIDQSAKNLDIMYVSGGKRGVQIGLHPDDVLRASSGVLARISKGA